jgi:hypothetical protein
MSRPRPRNERKIWSEDPHSLWSAVVPLAGKFRMQEDAHGRPSSSALRSTPGRRRVWESTSDQMGAARDNTRVEPRLHRQLGRECRAAGDPERTRGGTRRHAMGDERLHADTRQPDFARRRSGRPSWATPGVPDRAGGLRRHLDRLRTCPFGGVAGRRASGAGRRCGPPSPREPSHHRRRLFRRGARPGDRHLGRRLAR